MDPKGDTIQPSSTPANTSNKRKREDDDNMTPISAPLQSPNTLLYMEPPVLSVLGLMQKFECFEREDDSIPDGDILHQPMDKAPPDSQKVAVRLSKALKGVTLCAGEADCEGIPVVITAANDATVGKMPEKDTIFEALRLKGSKCENGRLVTVEEMTVESKDYAKMTAFQFSEDEIQGEVDLDDFDASCADFMDSRGVNLKEQQKITKVLAEDLTDHFESTFGWPPDPRDTGGEFDFETCNPLCCAPILYGGRCPSDGTIVAVLGFRVWT